MQIRWFAGSQRSRLAFATGILIFLAVAARAQREADMDSQTRLEVGQLRSIAHAIKACSRVPEFPDTGNGTIYDGPPSNVVWDVKASSSIRAPYMGYIEFFLPREFSASQGTCAKNPRYCGELISDTKPFRYRYEFDLGPDGLALVRVLIKGESEKRWQDARPDKTCWQGAAHLYQHGDDKR
jgi:hypothetical protein